MHIYSIDKETKFEYPITLNKIKKELKLDKNNSLKKGNSEYSFREENDRLVIHMKRVVSNFYYEIDHIKDGIEYFVKKVRDFVHEKDIAFLPLEEN